MSASRKPALGMTEPDWDLFTPEQNVVHLAPVIGLEAALTAVYGPNWVFDLVEDAYLTSAEIWIDAQCQQAKTQVLLIYFWLEQERVCVGMRTLSCQRLH